MKRLFLCAAALMIALALCLGGCAGQHDTAQTDEAVIADGLAKIDVDGKTYYSYYDQNYKFDNYGLLGYAPGERVILDEDFNEVKRITMEASDVTEKGQGADGHDFLMIDPDHYILSCYVKENVKNVPGFFSDVRLHTAYAVMVLLIVKKFIGRE